MTSWIFSALVAAWLLGPVSLGNAFGQTAAPSVPAPNGPYEQLSTGNQKVALALWEAQKTNLPAGKTPLTLDQIAAQKKPGGEGWGRVFQSLKTQGLVDAKNLGQVVSAYHHHHHLLAGEVTTAGNHPTSPDTHRGAAGPADRDDGTLGATRSSHAHSDATTNVAGRSTTGASATHGGRGK